MKGVRKGAESEKESERDITDTKKYSILLTKSWDQLSRPQFDDTD